MGDISDIIRSEVKKWKNTDHLGIRSATDINNGYCKEFARDVVRKISDQENADIRKYGYNETYTSYSHAYIEYNNLYYDAECPEGVQNPSSLPIFQRGDIEIKND